MINTFSVSKIPIFQHGEAAEQDCPGGDERPEGEHQLHRQGDRGLVRWLQEGLPHRQTRCHRVQGNIQVRTFLSDRHSHPRLAS